MSELKADQLTDRQAKVLRDIAAADGFITFSALAHAQGVSSRTVIRELDECEHLLQAAGVALERKAGLGIRLAGGGSGRERLDQLLDGSAVQVVFSVADRLAFLRQSLLRADEPIKLFTLNRQLKAAESTISGDLDRLEPWFSSQGLALVRRPGLGIYLEGPETARRKALIGLINEIVSEDGLIELVLQPDRSTVRDRLRQLFRATDADLERLHSLVQIIEVWEKTNQLIHRERNFLNMVLMLLVLTWRRDKPAEPAPPAAPASLNLLATADSLLEEIAMAFGMPWLVREVTAVAAQLPVLYPELTAGESAEPDRGVIDTADLVRQMLTLIQGETGYAIIDESEFIEFLTTHLQLALTRLKFGQVIYNPLEKEIRENYPKWFELARKCAGLIEDLLKKPVPDSETAYLTMYLGAAMEKAAARSERRYHIAVLCPAGMSSSVLLASRVEAVFPQVSVDAIISFHQAAEIIRQQRFDMILTTAYIVLPGIPVLTVRPFFPKEDQDKLRQFLTTLVPRKIAAPASEKADLKFQLGWMNELVSGLFSLLDSFFCETCPCKTLETAIAFAAAKVLPDNPSAFAEALNRREAMGHVVLEAEQMALIHARSPEITSLHFGVLTLDEPLQIDGNPVHTLLIMAAPQTVSNIRLDIMRQISRSIVEDDVFSRALRQGSRDGVYVQLERILKNSFPLNLPAAEEQSQTRR